MPRWRNGRRVLGCLVVGLAIMMPVVADPSTGRDIKVTAVDGKTPAEYVAARAGRAWAVVIGIDEYDHVPRLTYAVADAQGVSEVLREQGFQVTTLTNEEATRRAILQELGDKLVERVGPDDRVVIFFAGHGEDKQAPGGPADGVLAAGGRRAAVPQWHHDQHGGDPGAG